MVIQYNILDIFIIIIIGKIKVISTSKIKKIMEIKKKWIEKGIREEFKGSNPHSKGEFFSRSIKIFFDSKEAKIIMKETIIIINIAIKNKFKIIYTKKN